MAASRQDVHALAERLCALLNDCADAGVVLVEMHVSGQLYRLAAAGYSDGWKHIHQVYYNDESDYWDVEEAME